MPTSYTEDVAAAALERQGYVVVRNIWFRGEKDPAKRTHGWTDIDILAVGPDDVLICSCKAFLGYGKAATIAIDLAGWFKDAVEFVQKDARIGSLTKGRDLRKVVVVDVPGTGTVIDALNAQGIEVVLLRDLFVGLVHDTVDDLRILNPKVADRPRFWVERVETILGKDEDVVRRLVTALLWWDVLRDDVLDSRDGVPVVGQTYGGIADDGVAKVVKVRRTSAGGWRDATYRVPDSDEELVITKPEWETRKPRRVATPG